jgi:hypothetical protein
MTQHAVLKLKLGRCLSIPTRRFHRELDEAAYLFGTCWTRLFRLWERWREDHDFSPPPLLNRSGEQMTRKGCAIPQNQPLPLRLGDAKGESGENWFFRQTKHLVPQLSGTLRVSLSGSVWDWLRSKTPYNHAGKAYWNWQAVLMDEVSRPRCRDFNRIEVKGSDLKLRSDAGGIYAEFPLWSKSSGRGEVRSYRVRILIGRTKVKSTRNGHKHRWIGLTRGQKQILFRAAAGEVKLSASEFIRKDGKWYLHLCYALIPKNLGLDENRQVRVFAGGRNSQHALIAVSPEGERWYLGPERAILADIRHVEVKRAEIRRRYELAGSGRRGHGQARARYVERRYSRSVIDRSIAYQQKACSDLVKFCQKTNCGSVVYVEPKMQSRAHSWFAARDLFFNWTGFASRLFNVCLKNSLVLTIEPGSCEQFGGEQKLAAREPDVKTTTGVAHLKAARKRTKGMSSGQLLAKLSVKPVGAES